MRADLGTRNTAEHGIYVKAMKKLMTKYQCPKCSNHVELAVKGSARCMNCNREMKPARADQSPLQLKEAR